MRVSGSDMGLSVYIDGLICVFSHVIEVNAGQNIPEERAWDYFIDILLGVEYCE